MARNDPTVNIDAFLGIRNTEQSRRMRSGSMELAENIDIDDLGGVVKRNGYSLTQAFTNITAAFCSQNESRVFIIDNGTLKKVNDDLTDVDLLSGFDEGYVYWLEIADYILMSTGHVIDVHENVSIFRIPNPPPVNVSSTTGSLLKGRYQVVCNYVASNGRQGGASEYVSIEVEDFSGIVVTPEYNGYMVNIFISDVDSDTMYLVGVFKSGSQIITTTLMNTFPIAKEQLMSYPMPDGVEQIAFFESKLWGAEFQDSKTIIWYSQPFWWNLFALGSDYIAVPGKVNMLVGTSQGLIIGTDDEIYAYTTEGTLARLADYGVPEGLPYSVDDNGKVFIHSKQGLCSAFPFVNLTEEKVSLPPGDFCHTSVIEQNGFRKVVILTDGNDTADNKLGA